VRPDGAPKVTCKDFPDFPFACAGIGRLAKNGWREARNIMAREKVHHHGHALAATARDRATVRAAPAHEGMRTRNVASPTPLQPRSSDPIWGDCAPG
jgi:hypothetical protein